MRAWTRTTGWAREWVRAKVRSERQDRPPRHQRSDIGEREGGGKKGLGNRENKDIGEEKGKEENMRERKGEGKNGQG